MSGGSHCPLTAIILTSVAIHHLFLSSCFAAKVCTHLVIILSERKGVEKASCGETVVQKGVLESLSLLCPLGFSGVLRANLKGAEKKLTLQKHPFGKPFLRTTPFPLLWRPHLGWKSYIYIYAGELVLVPLFGLSRVRNSTTFFKKIIPTAARSKSRVRNRPTGELETVPPQRPFFCTSRWYCS